jgi:predicted O-methyltransferase YrrM
MLARSCKAREIIEFEASRVARAREYLTAGGLLDLPLPGGAKALYAKILRLVESRFRTGAYIVADASLYKFATCP